MAQDWADAILRFWFDELGQSGWWTRSDATDEAIRLRFGDVLEDKRALSASTFLDSASIALAGVILFDQFPRNIYRGDARAFATDDLARAIAEGAIARGYDGGMSGEERQFLYMPFMHSERLADQERALALFADLGHAEALRFARLHHETIARFGRFPHRNAALGRQTRPGEEKAVTTGADW